MGKKSMRRDRAARMLVNGWDVQLTRSSRAAFEGATRTGVWSSMSCSRVFVGIHGGGGGCWW